MLIKVKRSFHKRAHLEVCADNEFSSRHGVNVEGDGEKSK
jgi:hypothetical protein